MKNLLLGFCIMGLAVSPCLAQQPTAPVTPKSVPQAVETKTVTGEVKSVTVADPVKGTKSEIVVVNKSNAESKECALLVKSTTTIYDADWKAITLDKIKQDDKVGVVYSTTKEGVYEAISIRMKR
ncbi:MAG: hypothetical protein V1933_05255 [Candidatus Omnitrophota bacterium]